MNKRIILIIAAVVIVIAAVVTFWPGTNQDKPTDISGGGGPANNGPDAMADNVTGVVANPVSLPALMLKEFDGRDLKPGQVLADNEAYTRYYITYKSGELTISGIMNVPKGNPPTGGFPVLVLNHGHIDTSVYTNGRGLRREQDYLARQGFAVIHPDYRNHAQSDKDPDAETNVRLGYVEDAINLVYAVKQSNLAYLSKERIGMLGHSMGGGVTLGALVSKPDLVKAAVLFAPVSGNAVDNYEKWLKRRPEVTANIKTTFGEPSENPEFWKNISPENFYDKIAAPIQLHHGTADESVPLDWSIRLEDKLSKVDKSIEFYQYPGQPHEFTSAWPEVMQRTSDFFKVNL